MWPDGALSIEYDTNTTWYWILNLLSTRYKSNPQALLSPSNRANGVWCCHTPTTQYILVGVSVSYQTRAVAQLLGESRAYDPIQYDPHEIDWLCEVVIKAIQSYWTGGGIFGGMPVIAKILSLWYILSTIGCHIGYLQCFTHAYHILICDGVTNIRAPFSYV